MVRKAVDEDRFNPWLPLCAAVAATFLFLPLAIYAFDFGVISYVNFIAPFICLLLLVIAIVVGFKKTFKGLSILAMMIIYAAVTFGLFKKSEVIHTTGRWFLGSKGYKAELLAQPVSKNGEFRHIEWDGWGWAGGETNAYLVFDPSDSLAAAAKSHSPGKLNGIPCEFYRAYHLEKHWYSVVLYTDASWGNCT